MHDKTDEPCDCGVMSAMLNDPESGLTLGEDNSFHLAGGWLVYHCPFCGGLLPHSRKPIWYPRLDEVERARLQNLVEGITSAEEAYAHLGAPDYDEWMHVHKSNDGRLIYNEELSRKCRNLEYYHLSEHANVEFYFRTDSAPECCIVLKPISPRHIEEAS